MPPKHGAAGSSPAGGTISPNLLIPALSPEDGIAFIKQQFSHRAPARDVLVANR